MIIEATDRPASAKIEIPALDGFDPTLDDAVSIWPPDPIATAAADPYFWSGLTAPPVLGPGIALGRGSAAPMSEPAAPRPATAAASSGLVINATIDSADAPAGFASAVDDAIAYFEHAFTDPVTMNITFDWAPLGAGAVSDSETYLSSFSYSAVAAALTAEDAGIAADQGLVLPASDPFPAGSAAQYALATPANTLWLTLGEATALGLSNYNSGPTNTDADGAVTVNADDAFNFDPTLGGVAGEYDAVGVIEHEISEMMGRQFGGNDSAGDDLLPEPLALLRYSSPGVVDASDNYAGGYFSIDGGQTDLHSDMGEQDGDLADWGGAPTDDSVGFAATGVAQYFTPIDARVMQALGWAPSADDYWLGGVDGWGTVSQWSEGVPTATAHAVVAGGGPEIEAPVTIGSLTLDGGATLTLAGGYLNLTGAAAIADAEVDGSRRLITRAATTVSALTIGGAAQWWNAGTATQSGDDVTVGDQAGDAASLLNAPAATYAIADDGGVGRGGSTASRFTNQGLFEKTGGVGTSTVAVSFTNTATVTANSGTLAFSGPSNSFAGAITGAAGAVQFAGGSTALRSGTVAAVAKLSETGAGTVVTLQENLAYFGTFAEGAGAILAVGDGAALTLNGANTLSGIVNNLGALDLSGGGSTAIDAGAALRVAAWGILGAGTTATANTNVKYAGNFSEAAGDTFTLSGGYLLLTGSAAFSGGTVDGAKILYTEGTTTAAGLTIGGTAQWENTGTVTATGAGVTIGDAGGSAARLLNASTGIYDIADDSGVGIGKSASSSVANLGLLEKTGGAGTSTIAAAVDNAGAILVSSGKLDLKRGVVGTGTDTISGASTLEFDYRAALTQTIDFTGAGGALVIESPGNFSTSTTSSAAISGFDTAGTNDTIEVAGPWTFAGFVEIAGGARGSLNFADGANDISLTLLGDYDPKLFHASVAGGATSVGYG